MKDARGQSGARTGPKPQWKQADQTCVGQKPVLRGDDQ